MDDITGGITEVGTTIDDAAGEAYDKVARLLGLPYPGGPVIDRAAQQGDPKAIRFPRGLTAGHDMVKHRFDFSFSGLKTAVARWVETDVITAKAVAAAQFHGITHMIIGGGVAANSRLRGLLAARTASAGIELRRPRPALCTDNGAMIACLGAQVVKAGLAPSGLTIAANSGLPVETVVLPPAA